jgi:exosortase N
MELSLKFPTILKNPWLLCSCLAAAGYLLVVLFFLHDYLEFSLSLFAGMAFAPYIFIVRDRQAISYQYFWIALAVIFVSFFLKLKTVYFISLVFAILFLIETIIGKLNYLPMVLLILLCPIFPYFTAMIGIPARLELTELAGELLNLVQFQAAVSGNIIIHQGEEFSVDPACMGLSMISISFLLAMFVISYYERNTGKQLSTLSTSICLILVLPLNILCNLFRILVLVIFRIAPENIFHDLVGIVCLLVYVVLPFIILVRTFYHFTSKKKEITITVPVKRKTILAMNFILLALIAFKSFNLRSDAVKQNLLPSICHIDEYKKEIVNKHVIKFEKENYLIYVKPVNSFYGAEHTPMICWTGSGYKFKNIRKRTIRNTDIYIGILEKGKDIIHTAWWFDNGIYKTINQLDWRWRVMKGEDEFSLINVNASNEKDLLIEINKIINKNIFI